jgi:hypothetical protein
LEILRARRLAELDIDFLAEAGHGERILSRAYGAEPRSPVDGRAFRHTLLRLADGRELARARSVWV